MERNARPLSERIGGGSLNPAWVEWLMNWPLGWTAMEPLSEDAMNDWSQPGWWDAEPADVPRTMPRGPDHVVRLSAIGNGQVPQCMALAWELLK